MKKAIYFLLLFFTSYTLSYSQSDAPQTSTLNTDITQQPVKKADYSLSTGTSFSTGALKSTSFYIAPQMNYQLTPKFKLRAGLVFIRSNMSVPSNATLNLGQSQNQLFEQRTSETIVYASGDYQLNNKISLTGSVMKNFNKPVNSKLQNSGWNNTFQMMSMGMQYKITPNMTLGAQVKVIQGNNLYNMYNPFYYNMYPYDSPNPEF